MNRIRYVNVVVDFDQAGHDELHAAQQHIATIKTPTPSPAPNPTSDKP